MELERHPLVDRRALSEDIVLVERKNKASHLDAEIPGVVAEDHRPPNEVVAARGLRSHQRRGGIREQGKLRDVILLRIDVDGPSRRQMRRGSGTGHDRRKPVDERRREFRPMTQLARAGNGKTRVGCF